MNDELTTLADIAAQHSQTIMARSGQLPLASYIKTKSGVQMLVAGATDHLNKQMFGIVTKICGAKHEASATAVVMETWSVKPQTDEEKRLFMEIRAQGRPFSDHPSAEEKVIIIVGDGMQQEVREYAIIRHHQQMVELSLTRTERLSGKGRLQGDMADLHARPEQRDTPAFRDLMAMMDVEGLLDATPIGTINGREMAN